MTRLSEKDVDAELLKLRQKMEKLEGKVSPEFEAVEKLAEILGEKFAQIPRIDIHDLLRNVLEIYPQIDRVLKDENSTKHHLDLAHSTLEVTNKFVGLAREMQATFDFMEQMSDLIDDFSTKHTRLQVEQAKQQTEKATKKALATSGIQAKLRKDPKQQAKAKIKDEYGRWKANCVKYRSAAAFARKMVGLHVDPHGEPLVTTDSVEKWASDWGNEKSKSKKGTL